MNTLATSLLLACLGVVLTLLLRRPLRRLTGAGPTFCLWLLPLLLAAVAWLPVWHTPFVDASAVLVFPRLVVEPQMAVAAGGSAFPLVPVLFGLWLAGCGVMLARLTWHCVLIARRSRPLPENLRARLEPHLRHLDHRVIRLHPAGPAVCWLPGCRLLLPTDITERFSDEQLVQVMAHERMHLARRDPLWSLLAELTLATLWFFPLAWLAMNRFRLDQELACDAAIVSMAPGSAGAYARTLLSSVTSSRALVASTPWLSPSQLKERLTMIQHHSRSILKRRGGYAALIVILAGMALTAHAALPAAATPAMSPPQSQATGSDTPASVDMSFRQRHPPRYPPEAIKNKHEGTVVLRIHVDAKGHPIKTEVKQSSGDSSLDAAAIKAAMQWKFNPQKRNGKPVSGWAQVPVTFQLSDQDTKSGPASSSSEAPVLILLPASSSS